MNTQELPPAAGAPPGRPRLRDVPRPVLALAALVVVLAVAAVAFAVPAMAGFRLDAGRDDALAAARRAATNLTSFDFESATPDTQRLWASGTPDFERSFADDEASFTKMLQDNKLKVSGTVTGAGLYGYTPDETHALVAVKASVRNAATPDAQERDYRMDLTMVRQSGHWLVDSALFLS
jgi:Mce-associated membrane protein